MYLSLLWLSPITPSLGFNAFGVDFFCLQSQDDDDDDDNNNNININDNNKRKKASTHIKEHQYLKYTMSL